MYYCASVESLVNVQLLGMKSNINNYTAYSVFNICSKPDLTNKWHLFLIDIFTFYVIFMYVFLLHLVLFIHLGCFSVSVSLGDTDKRLVLMTVQDVNINGNLLSWPVTLASLVS